MGKTIDVKFRSANSSNGKSSKGRNSIVTSIILTVILAAVLFYIFLPAINLQNPGLYVFVFIISGFFCLTRIVGDSAEINPESSFRDLLMLIKRVCFVPALICLVLVVIYLGGSLLSSVIFRANAYSGIMTVEAGNFSEDVAEISYDKIPMLDKQSAERLGDRKLGELSDMVSQFEVSSDYNQINYKNTPVRIATLQYGDIFKWLKNRSNGIPAYIIIDMVTQNVNVVRLEEGIKYTTCEHFSRNLERYIRFRYPTFMFAYPHMEIDDSGTPWWICPRIVKSIGLFGGTDVNGVVLVNAVTGENMYCRPDEIPMWVDQVFSADLLIEQYDYHGMYINGFLNSIFTQTGVTNTTDGYNYIALDDDVFIYTGITSVGGDESNIGFILSNMRTKETKYYACAGAEEFSAMSSAEGIVQQMKYTATFPLLLNVSNHPTYFIALKDNAGLVKMFAMVNVQQYNIVATGATVSACEAEYINQLATQGLVDKTSNKSEINGTVEDVKSAIINGNSIFYFKLSGKPDYYAVSASDCEEAVLVNVGDKVSVFASATSENGIVRALSITLK